MMRAGGEKKSFLSGISPTGWIIIAVAAVVVFVVIVVIVVVGLYAFRSKPKQFSQPPPILRRPRRRDEMEGEPQINTARNTRELSGIEGEEGPSSVHPVANYEAPPTRDPSTGGDEQATGLGAPRNIGPEPTKTESKSVRFADKVEYNEPGEAGGDLGVKLASTDKKWPHRARAPGMSSTAIESQGL